MISFCFLSVFGAFVFFSSVFATPASTSGHCSNPSIRLEWRNLTTGQKSSYIEAVKCLQASAAIGIIPAAKTRFDDFSALHINLTDEIHFVGQFLPWHRQMMHVYEKTLKTACGYKGPFPYWDWSLDVDNNGTLASSPVWDPITGFGGNGPIIEGYNGPFGNNTNIPGFIGGTGGGCLSDGPFAGLNISVGPGTLETNHCLTRAFDENFNALLSSDHVTNGVMNETTFDGFRVALEGNKAIRGAYGPHGAGHFGIGGEMSNPYSPAGDPIFYLHHTNLDRLWWIWQKADLTKRLTEISGRTTVDPPFVNVTLAFKLKMYNLAPEVAIADVMDIRNSKLCYEYR